MTRAKEEIAERSKLIRAATPDCLEELFEMQNRICDLCGHPIQDKCFASLDHSTSVQIFAKGVLLIEEAVKQANDFKNLRAVHSSCNTVKKDLSREEWFLRKLNNREKLRCFTEPELEEFRAKIKSCHRPSGLKVVESGQLRAAASISGRIHGPINGRANKELKRGIFSPHYDKGKGGRTGAGGRKNVETGHIQALGRIQGRKNAEKGLIQGQGLKNVILKIGLFNPKRDRGSGGRIGGPKGMHVRWHVNRGLVKAGCNFCGAKEQ